MSTHIATVAVDLAKSVFQLSLADDAGLVVGRQRLSRTQFSEALALLPPAHVVMEACGTAHYWGQRAQAHGHRVTLLPPKYVRPYVRRNKTDRADADALLEAAKNPDILPVPLKSVQQQLLQALHRQREQHKAERVARINSLRGVLREFGVALPVGVVAMQRALAQLDRSSLPVLVLDMLQQHLSAIQQAEYAIDNIEKQLQALTADSRVIGHLRSIPGIGPITASALVAAIGDIHVFKNCRRFASWLGLTQREHSSGNTRCLGRISKRGDVYLRMLLTHCARTLLLSAHRQHARGDAPLTHLQRWMLALEARSNANKATIAVANKLARIIWSVWSRDKDFQHPPHAT